MAYTVKVPGLPPRNYNNINKALMYYRSSSAIGTWLRNNKTSVGVKRYA